MSDIEAKLAGADRAAAAGDMEIARQLLEQAVMAAPQRIELWVRLASMRRATGDQAAALNAVAHALSLNPLDFVALLLKASLLEALGRPEAGEIYGHALAQRPESDLSPALERMTGQAQEKYDQYIAQREARLVQAMAAAAQRAEPDEQLRLARFRSNSLRRTHIWHSQPTHFAYPGLIEREFHDRSLFPWLTELERNTSVIAEEFAEMMRSERAELLPYVQFAPDIPVRQWQSLNHSRDWTAIHLLRHGLRVEANARHCPKTLAALAKVPQPFMTGHAPNAMFSLLAAHTKIPPHTGIANTRLVCHLPLIVPPNCWFRVGAETREWRCGEGFVFDDTIEHEAANESDELRVVLIVDVWHPGLSARERAGVAAMIAAEAGNADL